MNLFKKKAYLFNGDEIHIGDKIMWWTSDGKQIISIVQKRTFSVFHAETHKILKKGTLFIHNNWFEPADYMNARHC